MVHEFFNTRIKTLLIAVFLLFYKTECLLLRYGFENQFEDLCHIFPVNPSYILIILRNSNGTIIWSKINEKYTANNFENYTVSTKISVRDSFVNDSLQLCFWNLSKSDIGNYSLEEVRDKSWFQFFIDVDYEAKILKIDVDSNGKEYVDVNLTCDVDSNPPANITWVLPNGINHRIDSNGKNSILTIANCSCEHTDNYTCMASNNENTVDKADLFLNITCGPKFKKNEKSQDAMINVNVGENLDYIINFTANPYPEIITELKTETVSFDAVNYALFVQKQILNEGDFKAYTIIIRNNFGVANFTLYVIQRESNTSNMTVKWLIISIATVSAVLLVSVLVFVVMFLKRKRKKKKRKKVSNGDYRDNVLYEPTPLDFPFGIQQRDIDTVSIKSNEVGKNRATNSELLSLEKNLLKYDNTVSNSSTGDQRSTQRRKPVPTPRRNKRGFGTDFQNTSYWHKETHVLIATNANQSLTNVSLSRLDKNDVTMSCGSLLSEASSLSQSRIKHETPGLEKMEIINAGTDGEDRNEFLQRLSGAITNGNKSNKYKEKAGPLNYIEVECPNQRKASVDVHDFKQRSNYHLMLNDCGVIVPMTSEDNRDQVYIDSQDNCAHIVKLDQTNENTQGNLIEPEDKCIDDKNSVSYNKQELAIVKGQTGLDKSTSRDASKDGYIYRWRIRQNSFSTANESVTASIDGDKSKNNYVDCSLVQSNFVD